MHLKAEVVCLFVMLSCATLPSYGVTSACKSPNPCLQEKIYPDRAFGKSLQGLGTRNPEKMNLLTGGERSLTNSRDRLKRVKRSNGVDAARMPANTNLFDTSPKIKPGTYVPSRQVRQKKSVLDLKPDFTGESEAVSTRLNGREALLGSTEKERTITEMTNILQDGAGIQQGDHYGSSKDEYQLSAGNEKNSIPSKRYNSNRSPAVKSSYQSNRISGFDLDQRSTSRRHDSEGIGPTIAKRRIAEPFNTEAPASLSGKIGVDAYPIHERQAEHRLHQPHRPKKVTRKAEISPANFKTSEKNFRIKRSLSDDTSEAIAGQRIKFQGTSNYVTCQHSESRQGDIIVGFQEFLEFHSPGYPDPYPNNLKCLFRFEIPVGRSAKLTCPVYDLDTGDRLSIDGLDMPLNANTGTVYPTRINRDFEMEFTTDEEGTSSGFMCYLAALLPDSELPQSGANIIPPWLRSPIDEPTIR